MLRLYLEFDVKKNTAWPSNHGPNKQHNRVRSTVRSREKISNHVVYQMHVQCACKESGTNLVPGQPRLPRQQVLIGVARVPADTARKTRPGSDTRAAKVPCTGRPVHWIIKFH